jgi:hypothetical protein
LRLPPGLAITFGVRPQAPREVFPQT